VAFFKDGRRVVTGSWDCTLRICNIQKGAVVGGPFVGHSNKVFSVAVSPDDRRIASGGKGRREQEDETGAALSTLQGHLGEVSSVAFNPDGLKLASGSLRTIRIWRTDNAELVFKINAHENPVLSVVWSPDGQQLVSASYDKKVKFWDSSNGFQIGQPCTSHTSDINSLAISFDGSFIATASDDRTAKHWSTKS
ncbi:WD40 repeat-like protein, partial [Suillus americanus]